MTIRAKRRRLSAACNHLKTFAYWVLDGCFFPNLPLSFQKTARLLCVQAREAAEGIDFSIMAGLAQLPSTGLAHDKTYRGPGPLPLFEEPTMCARDQCCFYLPHPQHDQCLAAEQGVAFERHRSLAIPPIRSLIWPCRVGYQCSKCPWHWCGTEQHEPIKKCHRKVALSSMSQSYTAATRSSTALATWLPPSPFVIITMP